MVEDYRKRFKSCGEGVVIEPGVWIEHPESFEVGDRVRFMRGFVAAGRPDTVRLGNDVTFCPNTIVQGPGNLLVGDDVLFRPGNYLELGAGTIEIGSHTHFAPNCVLYGQGGLFVGEYCGIAAHTVLATVAHDHHILERLMVHTSTAAPIRLTRDIWIGANAVVVGGVTMAEGSVLGAGGVLCEDTQPYGVYLGVPARLRHFRGKPQAQVEPEV